MEVFERELSRRRRRRVVHKIQCDEDQGGDHSGGDEPEPSTRFPRQKSQRKRNQHQQGEGAKVGVRGQGGATQRHYAAFESVATLFVLWAGGSPPVTFCALRLRDGVAVTTPPRSKARVSPPRRLASDQSALHSVM